MLLGRRTYEILAARRPSVDTRNPFTGPFSSKDAVSAAKARFKGK